VATWENLIVNNGIITLQVPRLHDSRIQIEIEVANEVDGTQFSTDPAEIQLISTVNLANGFDRLTFQDLKAFNPEPRRVYRLKVTYTP
jgi:hypothetical protein